MTLTLSQVIDQSRSLGDGCSFCAEPMLDSTIFEAGNGAEIKVVVNCCDAHVREVEADEVAFQKKYSERIEQLATEVGR